MPWQQVYELNFRLAGRPVRPWNAALLLSTGTIAVSNLLFGGVVLTGWLGNVVGALAALVCALLIVGFIRTDNRLAGFGLLLAVGVWTTRAAFIIIATDEWGGVFLSLAWAIGAAGAYLISQAKRRDQ